MKIKVAVDVYGMVRPLELFPEDDTEPAEGMRSQGEWWNEMLEEDVNMGTLESDAKPGIYLATFEVESFGTHDEPEHGLIIKHLEEVK